MIPGKVYRNEKMDASHDCVFRQLEGVVIDKQGALLVADDVGNTIWRVSAE